MKWAGGRAASAKKHKPQPETAQKKPLAPGVGASFHKEMSFDSHQNTHFQVKGLALGLALMERHKGNSERAY